METNTTYYIDLTTRYFHGEATPGEISELEAWVKAGPENEELFKEYQATWKILEGERIESSINVDDEWSTLKSKLSPSRIPHPASRTPHPASRILSWSLRVAAIYLLLAVPGYFAYHFFFQNTEKQLTALSGITEQTLPDGTVVTLNSGATLSYPEHFSGSFRKVTLKGEAWFEVAHDKAKPFIIAAENMRIRVVGTSFFVNTHTMSDTREVILSTGIVRVYCENKPEKTAILLPGEKAELTADGNEIRKSSNNDVNFLAWKTKHLVFSNTALNEVAAQLTRVYQTSIRLSDDRLSDCRITTTFDRQSLESVLNVLKATLDIQVRNTGTGIELSGHGCIQGK